MKNNRGIALITVFIVTGLMMLLLGAFITVNQRSFDLLNNDLQTVTAAQAARSAYDYCLFQLEKNRYWGSANFSGATHKGSGFKEIKELGGKTVIKGITEGTEATFVVEVVNNLMGEGAVHGVSKKHCRLRITATCGRAEVRREAMLTIAPLFDGSVVASKGISIDAKALTVSSEDRMRNRIRSKSNIEVPDYNGHFTFNPADKANEKGVLWAKDDIVMGSKSLSKLENAREAQESTGGRFYPGSDTYYDVYDLQIDEVKTNSNVTNIKPGIYVFANRDATYDAVVPDSEGGWTTTPKNISVPVLERREWSVNSDGELTQGDVREVWYMSKGLPINAAHKWINLYGDLPEDGLHPQPDGKFMLDTGVEVTFGVLDPESNSTLPPKIEIDSDRNIEVNGDFGVASEDQAYSPRLVFKEFDTGAVGTDWKGEIVSASITTKKESGTGKGSIYIEGTIFGNGKLLSDGDVTIKNTYADVESDEESGLSIYASGSVRISPQQAKWLDNQLLWKDGITAFKGLIFAGKDVIIDAYKGVNDNADVYIEGAVVAREGEVKVRDARHVHFNYNPAYLDSILKPANSDRVRLERVVWKEL